MKRYFPHSSFTPCYFGVFVCARTCVCVYVHLVRTNFVISASFPQSSEKLSFYLFLTPQLLEWQLVQFRVALRLLFFVRILRTAYSFSVAGSKRAQSPLPCPSSSIPAAWSSGMAWGLALSSSGHSYIPVILRGLQHLGLRKWVIVWPCKNTGFFILFYFLCSAVLQMYLIKCPSPHTLNQHSPFYSAHKWWNAKGKGGKGRKKREKDAIFFEVSRPAVYLINLYEIFLPKN